MRPSDQGADAGLIAAFLDALEDDDRIEPHGLIIQRHGHRIAEGYWAPHDQGRARLVYSLSKSFTGAALGLALGERRLTLDDFVSDHLPDYDLHGDAERLRIRHIASMATGHIDETLAEAMAADPANPVRGFLSLPAPHEPGTVFAYNQPPVLTLALILERVAGQPLSDYLRSRLLDPLGISTFRWERWPPGVDMGFSGVFTDLDAVAKLGQLHLDHGRVGDREILQKTWVTDASATHTTNPLGETIDWQQGYGFQLWQSQHGYRGDGAFGQFMVVLPEHHAVVAVFANTDEMQAVLDAMWAHLLPAFSRAGTAAADDALAVRLEELRLEPTAERLSTKGSLDAAQRATLAPADPTPTSHRSIDGVQLTSGRVIITEGEQQLDLPVQETWTTEGSVATSAARLADGTVVIDIIFLNTPHRLELTLANGEFQSDWGRVPLFGAGIRNQLSMLAVA